MTIKASGRSALILATGIWICFAGPLQAAPGAGDATAASKPDSAAAATAAKHATRHLKKEAHRKSAKLADKSSADAKAPTADAAADDTNASTAVPSSDMPPAVANANAQFSTDTPAGAAKAMSDRAGNMLQAAPGASADAQPAAGTPVVAADQLNDLDRALHDGTPAATPVALASVDTPPVETAAPQAASSESSTWDQTSLIGKIFIGFGALLTMASAARMFMA